MLVRISNFKSVESAEFELGAANHIGGPLASGKSNILDAIAFAGYFNRILLLEREYENNASRLEPLQFIIRFASLQQLFTEYGLTRGISVELRAGSGDMLSIGFQFKQGRLELSVNGVVVPWDLVNLPAGPSRRLGMRSAR